MKTTEDYVILYYAEYTSSGTMGPLKRARFASIGEAVDHAHDLRHRHEVSPIEIRDPRDNLITCALMGWRVPVLMTAHADRDRQLATRRA
jgi:hypothetical protein